MDADFFKSSWNVIKAYVLAVVHEFFDNNKLYTTINFTLVTMIPKNPKAKTMKKLRPIACCTTIYKIITKILASRLNKVIDDLVDDSQATLVSERVIHDTILISHELIRWYNCKYISPDVKSK